jgi:release factor glutamine methyltransferase
MDFCIKIENMFVQSNTIKAIKSYFREKLQNMFSVSEIKLIVNQAICSRLNLTKADLILVDEMRLSESDLLYFRSIVKRLQDHEPMQYVFGDTVFYDLEIKCDQRALIPRPETEELVDWIVQDFSSMKVDKILDLCTGSGCIALALKNQFSETKIQALEFSSEAIALVKENADALNLEIELIEMDVFEEFTDFNFEPNSYDIWVSNPPYIPLAEKALMHPNVLDFEPEMALFVENDQALIFYKEIALKALKYLKSGGSLYFELNENFADETSKLISDLGFIAIEIKLDLQGKKRMLKAIKKKD